MFNKDWNHCPRVSVWEWVCAPSIILDNVTLFPMRNVQEFQLLVASDLHQYMVCLIHFFGNINFIVCVGSCDFNHLFFFVSLYSSFYHSFNAAIIYLSLLLFYLNLFSPYDFLFQKGHVFLYPIVDAKKFLIFLLIQQCMVISGSVYLQAFLSCICFFHFLCFFSQTVSWFCSLNLFLNKI